MTDRGSLLWSEIKQMAILLLAWGACMAIGQVPWGVGLGGLSFVLMLNAYLQIQRILGMNDTIRAQGRRLEQLLDQQETQS